jgi:LacI family transcriptional regulator
VGRPTIRQVAADANVSIATVSGVLGQRSDCRVSEPTRRRVLASVDRLGYRPSMMAHALHGMSTMTVGLVSAFDIALWVRSVSGFEKAARDKGYLVLTASTHDDPQLEDRVIGEMLDRHVDALAVYPSESGPHKALRKLAAKGFPVVTFDSGGRLDFDVDDVSIDQFEGGRLQAQHLIEAGCRRVCLVNPAVPCHVNNLKIAGLEAGLHDAGLSLAGRMDLHQPWDRPVGPGPSIIDEIREHLSANRGRYDALAAVGDILALEAIHAARSMGLRVPEDLSVIGFNDHSMSALMSPPLTTIYDPSEELGSAAFSSLLEVLAASGLPRQPRQRKITPSLRVRQSTLAQSTSVRSISSSSVVRSSTGPSISSHNVAN